MRLDFCHRLWQKCPLAIGNAPLDRWTGPNQWFCRAADDIVPVAENTADMDGSEPIQELHLAEAVQYRLLDRKF